MFSETILAALVYAALGMTTISMLWLLALLYRDWRNGCLW